MVLILLTLLGGRLGRDRAVLGWTTAWTAAAAAVDFLRALPAPARSAPWLEGLLDWAEGAIPLAGVGFGWLLPALAGLGMGLAWRLLRQKG